MFRYYLTQRPPMPGAFPNRPDNRAVSIEDYDGRKPVSGLSKPAWGAVTYEKPLSNRHIREYELAEAGPFYMNRETGEILSHQAMLWQFAEEYDGNDPTNLIAAEEYYTPVVN